MSYWVTAPYRQLTLQKHLSEVKDNNKPEYLDELVHRF